MNALSMYRTYSSRSKFNDKIGEEYDNLSAL